MKVTILGSGDAKGVPRIGCSCSVCIDAKNNNSKNRRARSSIFIHDENILIDTPPELRVRLTDEGIEQIEKLFITHGHADHILGFDDLYNYNRLKNKYLNEEESGEVIDILSGKDVFNELDERFSYISKSDYYKKNATFRQVLLGNNEPKLDSISFDFIKIAHGRSHLYAFKFKKDNSCLGYISDMPKEINSQQLSFFKECDVLIAAGTALKPGLDHSKCLHMDEFINHLNRLDLNRVILTHLSHFNDFKNPRNFSNNFELACDGMVIKV